MNRPEALALVIAPMPPGYAREVVRATLKGWSADDVDAWHRLKDNERKQAKRDALRDVRLSAPQQTGQVPVVSEEEDRTSSGSLRGNKPDPSPSPQVSPTPPSSPTPTPTPSPAYTREDADIVSLIPDTLRTVDFLREWPPWIAHCREHAAERGKTFTRFTARAQLAELERMGPEKALRSLQVSGQRGSASIIDPDEVRFTNPNTSHPKTNGNQPRNNPENHRTEKRNREFEEPQRAPKMLKLD